MNATWKIIVDNLTVIRPLVQDSVEHDRVLNLVTTEGWIPGGKIYDAGKGVPWSYLRFPVDGATKVRLGYGYSNKKMRVSFRCQPENTSAAAFALARQHLDEALDGGLISLLTTGHVSYVEIAIDIQDVLFDDFFFVDTRLKHDDGDYELVGTTYLGNGRRQIVPYNKRKHLKNIKGIELDHDLLRIEARLRPKSAAGIYGLPGQSSPFRSLLLIPRSLVEATSHPLALEWLRRISEDGLTAQQGYVESIHRNKLRKLLAAYQPDWWNPIEMWKSCGSIIDAFVSKASASTAFSCS